ncbi:helix-turn-helix domain-containing protein [Halorubrum vacuolatum]|nr:helix-turn-helix domain-containing protein [Halorubrum vacuolatum]
MTWVRIRLSVPEDTWLGDISRRHPRTAFRLRGAVGNGTSHLLASLVTADGDAIIAELERHDGVESAAVVGRTDHEVTLNLTAEPPRFVAAADASGLPLEFPIEVIDGGTTVEVLCDQERLSAFGRALAREGVLFDVNCVSRSEGATRLLTETQHDLLTEAVDAGYYDTPRECTLTELAERYGIAKSTCSETLHRAEERLVKRFVADLPVQETPTETDEPPTSDTQPELVGEESAQPEREQLLIKS